MKWIVGITSTNGDDATALDVMSYDKPKLSAVPSTSATAEVVATSAPNMFFSDFNDGNNKKYDQHLGYSSLNDSTASTGENIVNMLNVRRFPGFIMSSLMLAFSPNLYRFNCVFIFLFWKSVENLLLFYEILSTRVSFLSYAFSEDRKFSENEELLISLIIIWISAVSILCSWVMQNVSRIKQDDAKSVMWN